MFEKRFSEIRADGRTLIGTAIHYGEASPIGGFKERFEPGAFGLVSDLDVILNVQHDRRRPLARTGGGGLVLTDSRDSLRWTAKLPQTRDSDDALSLVRSGVLRGSSIEFKAVNESWSGSMRTITQAFLGGLAVVDQPAHQGSDVEARHEIRRRGRGVSGSFRYTQTRTTRDRGRRRKVRVKPGAFDYALQADDREIQLILGREYSKPLASKLGGTLKLQNTSAALIFEVDRLPATTYVEDLRAAMASGAAVFGVDALYRIPPASRVPNAIERIPEPGNPEVEIEVINDALLTALAIVSRPPRGNPGNVAIETPSRRPSRRRDRLWLL